jgi:basic membrane protein A
MLDVRRFCSVSLTLALGMGLLVFFAFASAHARHEGTEPAGNAVYKPAIIYVSTGEDMGNAFISTARTGISRAEGEFRTPVTITRMSNMSDAQRVIKQVADTGATPIILLGNQYVSPVMAVADRYPNITFTIIDGLAPPLFPNVQSITFKDHEGAFLVGMIAGKLSDSKMVGFIGGMDVPLIRNFAQGYTQGVHYTAPNRKVEVEMIGTTADAWSNPDKARSLAKEQYNAGADIIFAAAGASSLGVLKAADEMGKLAIGVDSNQNGVYPGRVLTSMVKRVDVAVYDTLKNSHDGSWSAGIKSLGIKEGALDYAVDQNNSKFINEKLIEEVATAKDKIISGKLVVESYTAR